MASKAPPAGATARVVTRELEASVGPRLRERRSQSELSLRELARRLGISPSALSQIETGKSRPSVSTLYAIVSELGMSLDELFAPEAGNTRVVRHAPAAAEARVQRVGARSAIELESGVRWESLTAAPDPAVDFLYVEYAVGGASSSAGRFIRHAGREYGVVLTGTLEVTVGFDTYLLEPGDSISFDSTTPHRLSNTGDVPVTGIWFTTGRGNDSRLPTPDHA
jgi:transcriptional regulator with XRE-family HTH domain